MFLLASWQPLYALLLAGRHRQILPLGKCATRVLHCNLLEIHTAPSQSWLTTEVGTLQSFLCPTPHTVCMTIRCGTSNVGGGIEIPNSAAKDVNVNAVDMTARVNAPRRNSWRQYSQAAETSGKVLTMSSSYQGI